MEICSIVEIKITKEKGVYAPLTYHTGTLLGNIL